MWNGLQAALDIFVGQMLFNRFRQHKARANDVRADALLAIFGGDMAGEGVDGILRHGIGDLPGCAARSGT